MTGSCERKIQGGIQMPISQISGKPRRRGPTLADSESKPQMLPELNEENRGPARRHRGDIMSPSKRSALMARIKGRDTGPERAMAEAMSKEGWAFECHARDLP